MYQDFWHWLIANRILIIEIFRKKMKYLRGLVRTAPPQSDNK